MTADDCADMHLLIQADADGELTPSEAASVRSHLNRCPRCAAMQAELVALSWRIRREVPYHPAPDALRAKLLARVAALTPSAASPVKRGPDSWWRRARLAPFAGGFALAACLALVFVPPRGGDLSEAMVSDHIRALQPGHLMDVVSTDQHTVKPWFDGRLDFAPPVKDLKEAGFPLTGGRLDYLAGRPVAALIYQRGKHVIDVYVWPETGAQARPAESGERSGYNFLGWRQDGMAFWAVSDLAPDDLSAFVRLLRAG